MKTILILIAGLGILGLSACSTSTGGYTAAFDPSTSYNMYNSHELANMHNIGGGAGGR